MSPTQSQPGPTPEVRPRRERRLLQLTFEGLAAVALAGVATAWWMNESSGTGVLFQVDDNHVSVLYDAWSDGVDVDDAPGYRIVKPWLQDAYTISKSPIEYVMGGNEWRHHNHAPRLAVRAADGSNFWFEEIRIQYTALPDRAPDILRDAGGDFAWHHGIMDAHARAVLREAFGRYTAEEIVLQENLRDATLAARARLNEILGLHGLTVLELATSKAGFSKQYESVVQRRKVAEQEVQKIAKELEQLRASRAGKLAKLEREKQRAETHMRSALAFDLQDARRVALRARSDADRSYQSRLRSGERVREEKLSDADALVETYTKEAEGLRERADALAAQGAMAVRKALIEGLAKVQFVIAPHDPPPGAYVPRFAGEASSR